MKMGSACVTDCTQEISVRIKVCTLVQMCAKHWGFRIDYVCLISLVHTFDKFIFSDECENERDCSNHGACIDIQATSFPRRQCFCDPGWFGERCSRGKFTPNSLLYAFEILRSHVIMSPCPFVYTVQSQ